MRSARWCGRMMTVVLAACSSTSGQADGDAATPPDAGGGSEAGATIDGGAATDASGETGADGGSDGPRTTDAGSDAAAALERGARADEAVEAMLLGFWDPAHEYLLATRGDTPLTGFWTFVQAWDAVLDAVQRHPTGHRFRGTLQTLYAAAKATNAGGWSRDFYDDENWAALALIRAYDLTSDATYLAEAKTVYADIMAAWDTTCCGATPGGIWWDRPHTQKATAANAGPVITGARLFERTGDVTYRDFAKKVFAFWSANMVDPTTHQVTDNITSAGQKRAWKFTYNEGLMIGAAVALVHAGEPPSLLDQGHAIASFLVANETSVTPLGPVLTDGTSGGCGGDCMQFKGIAARYLGLLYEAAPSHAEYGALLERSADSAWTVARDPATGLFGVDWGAALAPPPHLEATSSAGMTLATVASFDGLVPVDPTDTYEAEEAVLHHVGLEAAHGAFGGWGYVAGWSADGQWVDFLVDSKAAATYDLAFRYAAGAGAASRLVYVNGANAVANQPFASTGGWDTYATVTVPVALPAGASTVSLIFNGSLGSAGYVNLDRLTVTPH